MRLAVPLKLYDGRGVLGSLGNQDITLKLAMRLELGVMRVVAAVSVG